MISYWQIYLRSASSSLLDHMRFSYVISCSMSWRKSDASRAFILVTTASEICDSEAQMSAEAHGSEPS